MNRREYLGTQAAMAASLVLPAAAPAASDAPKLHTTNTAWQAGYDKALAVLNANVQMLPRYSQPILIEGAAYQGIWMECGPHEALVYRKFRPDVARNSHMCFFELQRADGQLPCNNKLGETGFGQIQMVVPITATAWELARATGDEALLAAAYRAGAMWDDWLIQHRNLRGTGLTEGFCTYDTGHDNSPRWANIPPQCPNKDAKNFVKGLALPRLCPDLSATTYGARRALALMAEALGKASEAAHWQEKAETIRALILKHLYVAEDAAFYDLDAEGRFVRVRSDILSRVCGEHLLDQAQFDEVWTRQLHNPHAFWSALPLPSIALDDPAFVRPIPANSWGGASQALTALRSSRWFDHYNRPSAHAQLMQKWCEALLADMNFRQQADPMTGAFTVAEANSYSPAALVLVDFTWRLIGVVETDQHLEWNVRPTLKAAQGARLGLSTDTGLSAEMVYDAHGATLRLGGKLVGRIEGGTARLVSDKSGKALSLIGIEAPAQFVRFTSALGQTTHHRVLPDARLTL